MSVYVCMYDCHSFIKGRMSLDEINLVVCIRFDHAKDLGLQIVKNSTNHYPAVPYCNPHINPKMQTNSPLFFSPLK